MARFLPLRGEEVFNMLLITDCGCDLHPRRQLKYSGPEAKVMREVIANLPGDGDGHTYICAHGHCHRLRMEAQRSEARLKCV